LDLRHRHKAIVIIWLRAENLAGGADSGDTMNRLSSRSASGCAAYNNRKKDARSLYMMELASSRLPQALELRAFVGGNRDDRFAVDVVAGKGPRLFETVKPQDRLRLDFIGSKTFRSGVVALHYRKHT
jgi:hypothetical protein